MLDRLLQRVGANRSASLAALHRAYVSSIPFDDLTIQLGEQGPLDLDAVAARLLRPGGRGGYCFEINGVLAWMLEQLGFGVERQRAIVGPRDVEAPINHLALVIDGAWIAEAGYGEGPLEPLPLRAGRHDGWLIEPTPEGGWWIGDERPWSSGGGFTILPGVVGMDAFVEPHTRLSTSPDSSFVQTLVVQQPYDDHTRTLRARTFSVRGSGRDERRVLEDVADLDATLREAFGIALDAAQVARLWDAACAQHEAFLSR